jgi:hypothetical protein
MSVVIPPPSRDAGHRRNASLPSYTAAMGAAKTSVGATYPPPQVNKDIERARPVGNRAGESWLLSSAIILANILFLIAMITVVSPGGTVVVYLGYTDDGDSVWKSACVPTWVVSGALTVAQHRVLVERHPSAR